MREIIDGVYPERKKNSGKQPDEKKKTSKKPKEQAGAEHNRSAAKPVTHIRVENENEKEPDFLEEQPKPRKKKKHILAIVLVILLTALIIGGLIAGFHVKALEVTGTYYSSEEEIKEWLKKDKSTANALYIFVKLNYLDTTFPPAVESIKVDFKKPWDITLEVKEKAVAGYVDYEGAYLCFDKEGVAMAVTDSPVSDAAYVEGLELAEEKVKLGRALPVSDDEVFKNIVEASKMIEKYALSPDSVTCYGTELSLYFGSIEVLIGESDYENRMAQISPILEKLAEKYPDVSGTLHLEKFDFTDKAVRFVPES